MALVTQRNFTGGEISPSLHARADLEKYQTGVALMKNFYPRAHGGAQNRPGTKFLLWQQNEEFEARLIPFEFNTEQTYMLEFGHLYLRVIKDGGYVLDTSTSSSFSTATAANPVTITHTSHGYSTGDVAFISNSDMTEINNRFFVITVIDANTYSLNGEDGSSYGAGTFGDVSIVYTISSPYESQHLRELGYTQSADVLTITHEAYAPRNLSRTDHDAWSFSVLTFSSSVPAPGSAPTVTRTGTASGSDNKTYYYVTTAVVNGEESVASAVGNDGGGQDSLSTTYGNLVESASVTGADYYNFYKREGGAGIYGYIGDSTNRFFVDYNLAPDLSQQPPLANNPFGSSNNYPQATVYYSQRQVFGGTILEPGTLWFSQTGLFSNMNASRPPLATDAINVTLNSNQVNAIRHLVALDDLIALTAGAEWVVTSTADGAITPTTIEARPQSYTGCSRVKPVIIGNTLLYVQRGNRILRDFAYEFESDGYVGNDLTILARHLTDGANQKIVEMAYAQNPNSIVWCLREDGVLLSLTYQREQQVFAWARHETDGVIKSIGVIDENEEDVLYLIVEREINGDKRRYIERMNERYFDDIEDAFFVDSGLTYEGAATKTVSGLEHLEGETVVALNNGSVEENLTVTNGSVTLANATTKCHVGLPYNCDIKTLPLEVANNTIIGQERTIGNLTIRVHRTRGLFAGPGSSRLDEVLPRLYDDQYDLPDLERDEVEIEVPAQFDTKGQLYMRQPYPLPAEILSVTPDVSLSLQE